MRTRLGVSLVLSSSLLLSLAVGCAGSPAPSPTPPSASTVAKPPASAAAPLAIEPTNDPSVLTAEQRAKDAALAPKAAAFVDAFTNRGALLTRSGEVVYVSTKEGLPALYVGDATHPKAAPRKLPTPAERVQSADMLPDEATVLFTSDVGSDGNFHIFRVGIDGTRFKDLTPGEALHRDRPHVARASVGFFAYSAHATSDEKTRIFVQTAGDAALPREIHADPKGGNVVDVTPDGWRVLFRRFNAQHDAVLLEIGVARGEATRLYPPEGVAAPISAAAYSANGDRVLLATQAEGKPPELLTIDRATGKTQARYQEATLVNGSIEQVLVSPSGDRVAIMVDGGNHSELRILDARSLRLERTVKTVLGAAFLGAFTGDGARFTISQSRPDLPSDVFAVDAKSGAVTPLREEERAGFADLPPLRSSIESVPAFDGLAIPVNVYLPADADATRKLPTIVLIHGGPSGSAYVRWNSDARFFSAMGYAIVEPNIRGSSGFGIAFEKADDKEKRGDALKDVESVNRWARAQSFCDPDRMIIMGGSYGGYMTLLALTRQPALWRAGVDLFGMSDLRTMEKLEDQAIRVYDETEFGALGKDDAVLLEYSPLKDVDKIAAPVFVYQGHNDPVTPRNEADQMVKALRKRNIPVEYMVSMNEGHGIVRRANRIEFLTRAARFLGEHAAAR